MSVRTETFSATVLSRTALSPHLMRLVLGGPGLAEFTSTGIADEWVGLVVPEQFQSRYYTVRSWDGVELTLDIVVHQVGLVTEWAQLPEIVGQQVSITEPKGSFLAPPTAQWLMLVGDMTALPAMARIARETSLPTRVWAESDEQMTDYFADTSAEVTWLPRPDEARSGLADVVAGLEWPSSEGYFWMAGESAQMRAIRKHLMREVKLPSTHYDVMGYWRGVAERQPRRVDAAPSWRSEA